MLALLLIIAVDLIFRIGFSLHGSTQDALAFDAPYRSRVWWTTKDFNGQAKAPDVILIGASDINTALYTAEATYFKTPQSEILKHKSEYLEAKLKEVDSPYKTTFCFALGGEMPSDSYLLVNTLLTERKIPKAIFLAVTPRSFYDATFGAPSRTSVFKTMAKLGGTREFEVSCHGSLLDSADYVTRQVIALYGHKWEITSWQQCLGQTVLEKLLHENFENVVTPDSIRKISEQDLPEDLGPNEAMMPPYDEKHPVFIDNLQHYQNYYKKIKHGMLPLQVAFYERLCGFCSAHNIKLFVCNSPVTNENRNLIPPDIRANYLLQIGAIARSYGGTFVDLDRPDLFEHSDFYDSVHLNGKGGQKYFNQVALILSRLGESEAVTCEKVKRQLSKVPSFGSKKEDRQI
jgi:hypothetical protein